MKRKSRINQGNHCHGEMRGAYPASFSIHNVSIIMIRTHLFKTCSRPTGPVWFFLFGV